MCNFKEGIALLSFTVILVLSCKKADLKSELCGDIVKPEDTYVYPIRPGTSEWNRITSGDEQLRVCQIPDSIVSTISTEGLIQSWLDFSLVNEILLANSLQQGTQFFIANFSGLKELCKRSDAAEELYRRYQKMNPSCITRFSNDNDKGEYTFSFTYIEILLGQDTILNKLPTLKKKSLVAEGINKYNSKNLYYTYFGSFGATNSLFVCGKAMQNSSYEPFLAELHASSFLKAFLNSLLLPQDKDQADKVMKTILNHSSNFIK